MFGANLSHITAEACVPEQLVHYVRAVSGRRAVLCQGYAAYIHDGSAVLVAYPGGSAEAWRPLALSWAAVAEQEGQTPAPLPPEPAAPALGPALDELRASCERVTVLAPFRPAEAPDEAVSRRDCYWDIALPAPPPGQKLRNMLKRAAREVSVCEEPWGGEHEALVNHYLQTRPLEPGTRGIFSSLSSYVTGDAGDQAPQGAQKEGRVTLLAARLPDRSLAAFAVGDYSGLHTAFYMFAFRGRSAPPGTSDLLLGGLLRKADEFGHTRLNLGLAVNSGIEFFKKKWGARPCLPYVETSWELRAAPKPRGKGLLRRLFNV